MVACKRQQFGLKQGDFDICRVELLQLLQLHGCFLQQGLAQQQPYGGQAAAYPFVAGSAEGGAGLLAVDRSQWQVLPRTCVCTRGIIAGIAYKKLA